MTQTVNVPLTLDEIALVERRLMDDRGVFAGPAEHERIGKVMTKLGNARLSVADAVLAPPDRAALVAYPQAKTYRTREEITMDWHPNGTQAHYHGIVIPKGTRCRRIDSGTTAGKFFVDDFSWIGTTQGFLLHDASHRGIVLEPEQVETA